MSMLVIEVILKDWKGIGPGSIMWKPARLSWGVTWPDHWTIPTPPNLCLQFRSEGSNFCLEDIWVWRGLTPGFYSTNANYQNHKQPQVFAAVNVEFPVFL